MRTDDTARLQVLLDAYGADPRRWPPADRAHAAAAHAKLPADAFEAAGELDALLDALEPGALPAGLRTRLLARAPHTPDGDGSLAGIWHLLGGWRLAAPALAASLALGVGFGVGWTPAAGLHEEELLWLAGLDDRAGWYDAWAEGR